MDLLLIENPFFKNRAGFCFFYKDVYVKNILFLIPIFCLLLSCNAFAKNIIEVKSIGEFVLGDNDSKTDAKRIALEYAKRKALEEVGTLVKSETIVIDGVVTRDEIITYSSSILETQITSENLQILENKTVVYKVNILARIDKDDLFQRIDEVKKNKKKEEQILKLQDENKSLLGQLEQLNNEVKNVKDNSRIQLLTKRESLFKEIERNRDNIRKAFQRGDLFVALLDNKREEEQAKAEIREYVWDYIKNQTKINIGTPEIKNVNSDVCDIIVTVDYEINNAAIISALQKYLNIIDTDRSGLYNLYDKFDVAIYKNLIIIKGIDSDRKKPYSYALKRYISSQNISLDLKIGSHLQSYKISSSCRDIKTYDDSLLKYACANFSGYWDTYIIKTKSTYELKFQDTPVEDLKDIDSIEASIAFSDSQYLFDERSRSPFH